MRLPVASASGRFFFGQLAHYLSRAGRALLLAGTLSGCHSAPPSLTINPAQTVVMAPAVVRAGVTVGKPVWQGGRDRTALQVTLSNTRTQPVTLHYQFFWYDAQGLDVLPRPAAGTVLLPAGGTRVLVSARRPPEARQARLWLWL